MGVETQIGETQVEVNETGFQLFRIKPFGWAIPTKWISTLRQRSIRFQLFRIKPFGWGETHEELDFGWDVSNYSELNPSVGVRHCAITPPARGGDGGVSNYSELNPSVGFFWSWSRYCNCCRNVVSNYSELNPLVGWLLRLLLLSYP